MVRILQSTCSHIKANKEQKTSANTSNLSQAAVENEFVSDAFQTSDKDLDEVKAGMKLLGIDSLTTESNKNNGKNSALKFP